MKWFEYFPEPVPKLIFSFNTICESVNLSPKPISTHNRLRKIVIEEHPKLNMASFKLTLGTSINDANDNVYLQ